MRGTAATAGAAAAAQPVPSDDEADEAAPEAAPAPPKRHGGANVVGDAEGLIAHCKALIASYKCPRSVDFVEALPLSGAGKVLKTTLREPFWAGRSRNVA